MLKNNKKSFKNVCKKTNAKLHWQSKSSKFSPDRLKSRLTPQNRMLEKFKHCSDSGKCKQITSPIDEKKIIAREDSREDTESNEEYEILYYSFTPPFDIMSLERESNEENIQKIEIDLMTKFLK